MATERAGSTCGGGTICLEDRVPDRKKVLGEGGGLWSSSAEDRDKSTS